MRSAVKASFYYRRLTTQSCCCCLSQTVRRGNDSVPSFRVRSLWNRRSGHWVYSDEAWTTHAYLSVMGTLEQKRIGTLEDNSSLFPTPSQFCHSYIYILVTVILAALSNLILEVAATARGSCSRSVWHFFKLKISKDSRKALNDFRHKDLQPQRRVFLSKPERFMGALQTDEGDETRGTEKHIDSW